MRYEKNDRTFSLDTIPIVNNRFSIKGKVNGTLSIIIIGNNRTNSIDDPNVTTIFVEPGINEVILRENKFKEVIVKNSLTQLENIKFKETERNINTDVRNLNLERTLLKNDSTLLNKNEKINNVNKQIRSKLNILRKKKLNYTFNHRSSFLSPYLLTMCFNDLTADSLLFYYDRLSLNVKNSHYGTKKLS